MWELWSFTRSNHRLNGPALIDRDSFSHKASCDTPAFWHNGSAIRLIEEEHMCKTHTALVFTSFHQEGRGFFDGLHGTAATEQPPPHKTRKRKKENGTFVLRRRRTHSFCPLKPGSQRGRRLESARTMRELSTHPHSSTQGLARDCPTRVFRAFGTAKR